jgi:hypothetical protein
MEQIFFIYGILVNLFILLAKFHHLYFREIFLLYISDFHCKFGEIRKDFVYKFFAITRQYCNFREISQRDSTKSRKIFPKFVKIRISRDANTNFESILQARFNISPLYVCVCMSSSQSMYPRRCHPVVQSAEVIVCCHLPWVLCPSCCLSCVMMVLGSVCLSC